MGVYIYKVKSKPVMEINGEPVYPAEYAFKPWHSWDGEKINQRLMFTTGVHGCVNAWNKKPDEATRNVLVLYSASIYRFPRVSGMFYDDYQRMEPVASLWPRPMMD